MDRHARNSCRPTETKRVVIHDYGHSPLGAVPAAVVGASVENTLAPCIVDNVALEAVVSTRVAEKNKRDR